jgi:hypothetical protein
VLGGEEEVHVLIVALLLVAAVEAVAPAPRRPLRSGGLLHEVQHHAVQTDGPDLRLAVRRLLVLLRQRLLPIRAELLRSRDPDQQPPEPRHPRRRRMLLLRRRLPVHGGTVIVVAVLELEWHRSHEAKPLQPHHLAQLNNQEPTVPGPKIDHHSNIDELILPAQRQFAGDGGHFPANRWKRSLPSFWLFPQFTRNTKGENQ